MEHTVFHWRQLYWPLWRGHLRRPCNAPGHSLSPGEPEILLWVNTPPNLDLQLCTHLWTSHFSPSFSPPHTTRDTEKNMIEFHRFIFTGETISSPPHAASSVTNICSEGMPSTWRSSMMGDFWCPSNTKTVAQRCILLKDRNGAPWSWPEPSP